MSKTGNGSGKGSTQKPKNGPTTETDFKGKYTECNKELKKANAKISSLETELKKCRFDILSLQKNFNYEEVRRLLPSSMDNDGLQADHNARLTAEINDLRQQLETQIESQNKSGSSSNNKKLVDDSDTTIDRNKIQTLKREKDALDREKGALEREKSALKKEKRALETEKGALENEVKEFETKLARLKSENEAHVCKKESNESSNDKMRFDLEKDKDQLQEQLKKSRDECDRLKKVIEVHTSAEEDNVPDVDRIKETERLKSENEAHVCKKESNESSNDKMRFDLEKDKDQLQEQLKKSRDECDRLTKVIEVHTSAEEDNVPDVDRIKETERELKKSIDQISLLKKEIDYTKQANKEEKEKDQRNLISLQDKLSSEHMEVTCLTKQVEDLQERLSAQTTHTDDTAKEVENELREEIKKLKFKTGSLKELEGKVHRVEDEKVSLKQELETANKTINRLESQAQRTNGNFRENELIEEIEKLKSRLSQMAGAQLMTNNPNIADLSDANRPTKIAEQYTELYDNEWTNVYEILDEAGNSEFTIIDTLYGLLGDSFRYCIEKSVEQTKQLKLSLTSVQKQKDVISDEKIEPTKLRQLRELRKAFAPDMIDSVFQSYKKNKNPKHIDRSEMKDFVHKCITLCWFMAVQDPPVVIDTNKHTGTFNGDLFKTYTKSGKKIDFIVWPPLYLHDGGPMLSKGIAQGK